MSPDTPRIVTFDWDAVAAFAARLRDAHEARNDTDAVAVSLAAFDRWGVRPPAAFLEQHTVAVAAVRQRDN